MGGALHKSASAEGYARYLVSTRLTSDHLSVSQSRRHLIAQGESLGSLVEGESEGDSVANSLADRLHFPLPVNDEQQDIAERLRKYPHAFVKGWLGHSEGGWVEL